MLKTTNNDSVPAHDHEADTLTMRSSRQLFQERINSILAAPMPRCLQSSYLDEKPGATHCFKASRDEDGDGSNGVGRTRLISSSSLSTSPSPSAMPGATTASAHHWTARATRSLSANPPSLHGASARDASTTAPQVPIYEQLLQKGRLQQERREQLRLEAIEREMQELRPAPRVPLAPAALPVDPPQPARRRLPPAGQRIEDRLLQRAKDKAAQAERAAQLRREREEEDVAAIATFRPRISAHAQVTKARYNESPSKLAARQAKRLEELALSRQSAELAELQEMQPGPVINRHSAKLAADKKAREGLDGLPASEALLITEHRRRLAQWQAAEAAREARENASPAITQHAATMHRGSDVGTRLHAASYDAAIRRLQREVTRREAHMPFQPEVTTLAAVTAPRYQRENEARVAAPTAAGSPLPRGNSTAERNAFQPTINRVSAAIAQRLPETPMERLCRPSAVHSLSSYVDPTRSLNTSATTTPSRQHTPRNRTQVRLGMATTPLVPTSSTPSAVAATAAAAPPPLPGAVVASLEAYERRRQARLDALRREHNAEELQDCTFQPRIDLRSSAIVAEAARSSGGDESHGPSAVAQRSEAWQRQRERHVATMRQWQAERAAAAELADARVEKATASVPSLSIYGGDGRAWGVDAYLARQQLARAQRQERREQEELRRTRGFSDQLNVPPPAAAAANAAVPSLQGYRPSGDATIRSLRPPVSASRRSPSAQLWASASD
ncbi:hypothetical protein N2W54_003242 [Lotmaria passim]